MFEINAKIKIHMAGARVIKVVDKKTAAKWKRVTHRWRYKIGLTTIVIVSDELLLTPKQRYDWYKERYEKKDPALMRRINAIKRILGEEVEEEKDDWLSRALRYGKQF